MAGGFSVQAEIAEPTTVRVKIDLRIVLLPIEWNAFQSAFELNDSLFSYYHPRALDDMNFDVEQMAGSCHCAYPEQKFTGPVRENWYLRRCSADG